MTHDVHRPYTLSSHNARAVASTCAGGTMSIAASARKEWTASRRASQWALRVARLASSRAALCAAHQVLNCAYQPFASVARLTPMCVPHAVVWPCAVIVISFVWVLLNFLRVRCVEPTAC